MQSAPAAPDAAAPSAPRRLLRLPRNRRGAAALTGFAHVAEAALQEGLVLALEARIAAHRKVLSWLLRRQCAFQEERQRALAALEEEFPRPDGQEDPGAVPIESFAGFSAFAEELDALLGCLRDGQPAHGPN